MGWMVRTAWLAFLTAAVLRGEALAQPEIALNPASPVDCGAPALNTVNVIPMNIFNIGNQNLVVTAVSSPPAPFSTSLPMGVVLPYVLTPNAAMPFALKFAPVKPGPTQATFVISSSDPNRPNVTVTVTGSSGIPRIATSTMGLPFAGTRVGSMSMAAQVTVTNQGLGDLLVNDISFAAGDVNDFQLMAPNTPLTVSPGVSKVISITFVPRAFGPRSAQLAIASTDPMAPKVALGVSGFGSGPNLVTAQNTVNFALQRVGVTSPVRMLVIDNSGDLDGRVLAVAFEGAPVFTLSNPPMFPARIVPRGKVTLDLAVTPDRLGRIEGTLAVTTDGVVDPVIRVSLMVHGSSGIVEVTPGALDFGWQGVGTASSPKVLTIANLGVDDLNVGGARFVAPGGGRAFSFSPMPGWPLVISRFGFVAVALTFTPPEGVPYTDSLELLTDDPTHQVVTVPLTGWGSPLMAEPSMIEFPPTPIAASSAPRMVTVTNRARAPVSIARVGFQGGASDGFSHDAHVPILLAAGMSTNLALRFSPARGDSYFSELVIGGDLPEITIPVTGNGTWPQFTAAPLALDFGDVPLDAIAPARTVTIENQGRVDVELAPLGASDPAFTVDATAVPAMIAARSSATFTVTFHPRALTAYQGVIRLGVKGRPTSQLAVQLSGRGFEPPLAAPGGCGIARGSRDQARAGAIYLVLAAALLVLRRRALHRLVAPGPRSIGATMRAAIPTRDARSTR